MKQQQRSIAEAIQFTKFRLAAFRAVVTTREQRLAALEEERQKLDERVAALERACDEAVSAVPRLERELERLTREDAQRMAVGGSSRYKPTRAENLVKQRQRLLRRLAEVEASLPPELRGGAS